MPAGSDVGDVLQLQLGTGPGTGKGAAVTATAVRADRLILHCILYENKNSNHLVSFVVHRSTS